VIFTVSPLVFENVTHPPFSTLTEETSNTAVPSEIVTVEQLAAEAGAASMAATPRAPAARVRTVMVEAAIRFVTHTPCPEFMVMSLLGST
jgi:hypothetical protein